MLVVGSLKKMPSLSVSVSPGRMGTLSLASPIPFFSLSISKAMCGLSSPIHAPTWKSYVLDWVDSGKTERRSGGLLLSTRSEMLLRCTVVLPVEMRARVRRFRWMSGVGSDMRVL